MTDISRSQLTSSARKHMVADGGEDYRDVMHERLTRVESQLHKTSEAVQEVKDNTKELLYIFQTIKGGVKFFVVFVTIIKWFAGAVIAIGLIAAAFSAIKRGDLSFFIQRR